MYRVGIDGHMIGDHSGGNESYYSNVLKNMDFTNTDIEPILFLKDGVDAEPYENVFRIVRFKANSSFERNFIELPKLCKKYNLDLLHTQYFIPFYRPCPVVCTIHDICFEHFKDIFTKKEYFRQKILIPYAARHSKVVFTVSNHAKNDITKTYSLLDVKVYVTYNAVSSKFHKLVGEELNEDELRVKFQIGNEPYLLCVGNLQPRKNLPRLIRAYKKYIEKTNIKSRLVIVGKKAWMYDDVLKSSIDGTNNVILTDYVSEHDLIRLYSAAHAFIYPSYFEGFGIPPLEALACETPVAVANTTSLPEVVGNAGCYFDPFDEEDIVRAIETIMTDEVVRSEIIGNASKRVSAFSWRKSAETIVEAYLSVIK